MNRRILLNVTEMDSNCLSDIDFFQGCTQLFRELAGILVRPVSRTKARHRHRQDLLPGKLQHVKGAHGY